MHLNKRLFSTSIIICIFLLSGCMSREEAAKHVTITLIASPEASFGEWLPIPSSQADTKLFESPLGNIEITETPTNLSLITQPQLVNTFQELKQKFEQQVTVSNRNLINSADDDILQLSNHNFLHTTYHTRSKDNQRQRVELYLAPIDKQLITIVVGIGDDVDMRSYNELQAFLTQQTSLFTKR